MTASSALGRPGVSVSRAITPAAAALLLAGAALIAGFALTDPRGLRALLAAALVVVFAGLGFLAPRRVLYALVVWLIVLGFVRRFVTEWSAPGPADLLLLVGPAVVMVLFLVAARSGAFQKRTTFANAVLVLSLLVLLGAINPLQRSLTAGAAGLLFILVPTLGFWIGRVLCDDATLKRVLTIAAVFSIAEAAYGLAQTFIGFPRWDSAWIASHQEQYAALYVGDSLRPFGSFSSFAEYSFFLAIGLTVWVAVAARRRVFGALMAVVLVIAIFYASGRGVVVLLVAAFGMTIAAKRRFPLAIAAVATAAFLILIPLVASHFDQSPQGAGAAASLASHQIGGLANPLDPQHSTLRGHLTLLKSGLTSAYHNPLGYGIGGVTIAGAKFGGVEQATEADPSNMAVALGFPGILAYLIVVGSGLRHAYRLAVARGDALSFIALAIAVLMLLQWLNGGQYAVALLLWLVLGWADQKWAKHAKGRSLGPTNLAAARTR
jgi:hypothetical protein